MRHIVTITALWLAATTATAREFIHPGITYTAADLQRMKTMVEAGREPWLTTFRALLASDYSTPGDGNYTPITEIPEGRFNVTIGSDGRRAHDMALLYHLTGDRAYADDAVARLNRYCGLTRCSSSGTAPLDNGKLYLMLEAAELLRDYPGWLPQDQEAFRRMLTYPGYSTTQAPARGDDVTFYWNIRDLDPNRFGNQGLFAARSMLAMGIYLDNDTIFDRALRYLSGLTSRPDDLPYRPGPPRQEGVSQAGECQIDYTVTWPSEGEEYICDEALQYYIHPNGQTQESSRDQGHTIAGVGNYTAIAEICWSQGIDMYAWLDNRILLGMEWNIRYNMDTEWEPSGYSDKAEDCTYHNGMFYQVTSRSGRWKALRPASGDRGNIYSPGGWLTQALEHYRVRASLPAARYEWTQRLHQKMMDDYGHENWGKAPNWYYEWCGWGTLTKQRTQWMTGDPGKWLGQQWQPGMPTAPCTVLGTDHDRRAGQPQPLAPQRLSPDSLCYTISLPRGGEYRVFANVEGEATLQVCVDGGETHTRLVSCTQPTEWLLATVSANAGAAVLRLSAPRGNATLHSLTVVPLE